MDALNYHIEPASPQLELEQHERAQRRAEIATIGVTGALALGLSYAIQRKSSISPLDLPYIEPVMIAINGVDNALELAGTVGLPTAIAIVGLNKIRALTKPKASLADQLSGGEMTATNSNEDKKLRIPILRRLGTGKFPVVTFAAAAIASLTAAIGTEVTEGPSRPIYTIAQHTPGGVEGQLIVQNDGAMPMVQSVLSAELTRNIMQEAKNRGVNAALIAQNLGTITDKGNNRTSLTFGLPLPDNSPAQWSPEQTCEVLPLIIDEKAAISKGSQDIELQGATVKIVDTINDLSAINRIGAIADIDAVQTCLEKSNNAYAVALDADSEQVKEILTVANSETQEQATVISFEKYQENSAAFWEKNVKPITNIIALMSGVMAFVSIGGNISLRIARNRRELGTLLASGVTEKYIRWVETLRALKDATTASVLGASAAVVTSSFVSMAVYGMKASVGVKEAMVGAGTVLIGSISAILARLGTSRKVQRSIDPSNSTRI